MSYRNEERKSLWPHIFSSNWNEQIRIKGYGPAGQLMKHISVTFWFGLYLSWENNEELSLCYIPFFLSNWMIGFLLFILLLKHPTDLLFETEYWVGEEWLLTQPFLNWVPFARIMILKPTSTWNRDSMYTAIRHQGPVPQPCQNILHHVSFLYVLDIPSRTGFLNAPCVSRTLWQKCAYSRHKTQTSGLFSDITEHHTAGMPEKRNSYKCGSHWWWENGGLFSLSPATLLNQCF